MTHARRWLNTAQPCTRSSRRFPSTKGVAAGADAAEKTSSPFGRLLARSRQTTQATPAGACPHCRCFVRIQNSLIARVKIGSKCESSTAPTRTMRIPAMFVSGFTSSQPQTPNPKPYCPCRAIALMRRKIWQFLLSFGWPFGLTRIVIDSKPSPSLAAILPALNNKPSKWSGLIQAFQAILVILPFPFSPSSGKA